MQLDLFEQEATDREQRLEIKTRYRTNDPDTSRDAAESLVTSGRLNAQCERVLRLLKAHNGCTSAELAHQTDTDRSMIARRLPDLEKRGLVYKGETRKCEINGTNAKPWFVLLLLFDDRLRHDPKSDPSRPLDRPRGLVRGGRCHRVDTGKGRIMPRKRMSREEWQALIERCEATLTAAINSTGSVCLNVSGGNGSAESWFRCVDAFGPDRVVPVFADTNSESGDLHRFLNDCEAAIGQTLIRLNDGRDIWDVFDQFGVMRLANAGGACKASIELKQIPLAKFAEKMEAEWIAVGLGYDEPERIAALLNKVPNAVFPLVARPRLSACELQESLKLRGIKPAETYADGLTHNNCNGKGTCILAGLGQWAAIREMDPDGFEYAKQRERVFRERTGFTVLRDQRNGTVRPYSLDELDEDAANGREFPDDWRSNCSCMSLFSSEELAGMGATK